jgi:hypothetical protein
MRAIRLLVGIVQIYLRSKYFDSQSLEHGICLAAGTMDFLKNTPTFNKFPADFFVCPSTVTIR